MLAEAMIAVAFARTWHAIWREWHVLMAVAFGAIVVEKGKPIITPAN